MTARRVLVTGAGGTGLGAAVIQALSYADPGRWDVVAACADPFSWGLYAAPHRELLPWAAEAGYLDAVREVVAAYGAVAVIPGTEAETVLLAAARDTIGAAVIANEASLVPLMRDKLAAQDVLRGLGLPPVPSVPWARRADAVQEWGFPLLVKPTLESSASRGVYIVTSAAELEALGPLADPAHRPEVYPYLGDAGQEYSVMVLSGRDGEVIDSLVIHRELTGFSLREERQWQGRRLAVSTGYTQGVIVDHPEISKFAEDLARRLGSKGPLDLQLRMADGVPRVFEVQPRFSFSAPIRAAAGFNEPDVLLRNFLDGERFGRLGHRTGVAALRYFGQLLVPAGELMGGAS